jgi:hypothetical protein
MPFDILPFGDPMIPEAGALLALRHERLRASRPESPARFEEPEAARAAVEALWRRERAGGVAARGEDGRMRGYLIGDLVLDNLWGRSAWVRFAGCALAPDQDVELVRDLYAALASPWVAQGCFTHFAVMPSTDAALLGMWFALSFGIEQVHGLSRWTTSISCRAPTRRTCTSESRSTGPPLFGGPVGRDLASSGTGTGVGDSPAETQAEQRREWGDLVDDAQAPIWLALCQEQAVGCQGYFPAPASEDNPLIPEQCVELGVAGTREWIRGRGDRAGTDATRSGARPLRGYRYCLTDWRSTNLLSSRFWPRQGFRPVAYRLARRIDPRISWAGERRA